MRAIDRIKQALAPQILEKAHSDYNGDITVVSRQGKVRIVVSGLTQSGTFLDRIWQKAIDFLMKKKFQPKSCLILGLGGGTAAGIVSLTWPKAKITGLEIDPEMVRLGKKYLDLNTVKNLKIILGDARTETVKLEGDYDLILVDLYKGDKMPPGIKTEKFHSTIFSKLTEKGYVIFNLLFYNQESRIEAEKFVTSVDSKVEVKLLRELSNLLVVCSF